MLFYLFELKLYLTKHNDERLAKEVPEIDLILGGHDHVVFEKRIGETLIVKSGCNFNEFSFIALDFSKTLSRKASSIYEFKKYNLLLNLIQIDEGYPEDPELTNYVNEYMKESEKQMEKVKLL